MVISLIIAHLEIIMKFLNIFIYLTALVLVVPCGFFSCSMQTLAACKLLQHVGSSFLNTDGTQAPCIGSTDSEPLGHQGIP